MVIRSLCFMRPHGAPEVPFDVQRSGDLLVMLKPMVTPIADTSRYVATHGSPYDYDRRVPILFWRRGAGGTTIDQAVDTTDIMPTLAAAIGLPLGPGAVDGKCLAGISWVTCPAR